MSLLASVHVFGNLLTFRLGEKISAYHMYKLPECADSPVQTEGYPGVCLPGTHIRAPISM